MGKYGTCATVNIPCQNSSLVPGKKFRWWWKTRFVTIVAVDASFWPPLHQGSDKKKTNCGQGVKTQMGNNLCHWMKINGKWCSRKIFPVICEVKEMLLFRMTETCWDRWAKQCQGTFSAVWTLKMPSYGSNSRQGFMFDQIGKIQIFNRLARWTSQKENAVVETKTQLRSKSECEWILGA